MDKGYNSEKWLLQFPHRSDNMCMVGLVWQGQVHKTTLDHHLYWARTGSGETRGEQAGEPAGKLAQLSALCCVWRVCPWPGQIHQQAWVYILPRNPYLFYKTKQKQYIHISIKNPYLSLHLTFPAFGRIYRQVSRIWYKYHPQANQDPEKMFKFSFPEFVRFLVNGTKEFADDDYVLRHRGVSYHWENYWAECPVCHNLTRSVFSHLNVDLVTTGAPL